MTTQQINLGGAVLLFLLSLIFIGPMYIAVVSLILSLYIIITFFDRENNLLKNTVDTENHTIMTRSRRRLQEKTN
jgi:hypothetical protein